MLPLLLFVWVMTSSAASASPSSESVLNKDFSRIGGEFGFGVQRLSHTNKDEDLEAIDTSHFTIAGVSSDPLCVNVSTHYFPAVIDNFAPISLQQVWIGKGQRYWMNDELWGGPGFPVFVYIGGE